MSVRVMAKVFQHSQATLAARLVLLAVADNAHDDGVAWPSQEMLAAKALVAEGTVRRAIDELEALGELETRKAQRGRKRINVYRVVMPDLPAVEYDRLPFEIEPFTTAQSERSSEIDGRTSTNVTTAQSEQRTKEEPSSRTTREGANAPSSGGPPALKKVDGQDLAMNALIEACGIHPDSNRFSLAAVALNTTRGTKGIRELAWREWRALAEETGRLEAFTEFCDSGFDEALAQRILRKAALYRERMPGATLTPTALRDWWLDLELVPEAGDGGLTGDQIRNLDL